jgi:hypothetical protein
MAESIQKQNILKNETYPVRISPEAENFEIRRNLESEQYRE